MTDALLPSGAPCQTGHISSPAQCPQSPLAEITQVPPTSQGGRDEEVGAVLFDDGVDELLRGGSPAQQADAPLELRHQGQRVVQQVPPLDGCVPHLPTGKLPVPQHSNTAGVSLPGWRGRDRHWGRDEEGEGVSPVGHPHMDTHKRPRGWAEGKGRRRGKVRHYCTIGTHYKDQAAEEVLLEASEVSARELDIPKTKAGWCFHLPTL